METILVANRGEIACRVLRTAHALGYRTVAVYSDADAGAPHVSLADEAVRIGPAPVGESYLDPARILDAAARTGADAIHPGYGFLSEDAGFARAVQEAGLTWIGPPAEAIHAMGDKAQAKARMRDSGVPCVPGFQGDRPTDAELIAAAQDIGVPLLVKATAGGGGRGMRRVDDLRALPAALQSARAEARNAFGEDALLLERLVTGARHVEVQVIADTHGNTLHIGERDCSVQRRHQKVIEEAPSPAVDADLRARMGAAACAAAAAVGYAGAGTVEFLLDQDGRFYFLEMNTRLQVEHPVTEEVTGLDLVALQLLVAEGQPLPFSQDDVSLEGHAIEVRLYAEDPAEGYRPQTGAVHAFLPPSGPGIRVDHGIAAPGEVTAHYDPMIAKIIASGPDRETARRRLRRALRETVLLGVTGNRGLLLRILAHPAFAEGRTDTHFLEANPELAADPPADPEDALVAAGLFLEGKGGFQSGHPTARPLVFSINGARTQVAVAFGRGGLEVDGHAVVVQRVGPQRLRVSVDGVQRTVVSVEAGGQRWAQHRGRQLAIGPWRPIPAEEKAAASGQVRAPTAGRVLAVPVAAGDAVEADAVVAVVEAMKLETQLRAGVDGVISGVLVQPGESVAAGQLLVTVEEQA